MCRGAKVSRGRKIDVAGRLCVGGWSAWEADEEGEMAVDEWLRIRAGKATADAGATKRAVVGLTRRVIGRNIVKRLSFFSLPLQLQADRGKTFPRSPSQVYIPFSQNSHLPPSIQKVGKQPASWKSCFPIFALLRGR